MPDNPYDALFMPANPRDRVHGIASKIGISPDIADDYLKVTKVESGHNVNVGSSSKGAQGFGQVMPDRPGLSVRTIGGRRYNLQNPDENIEAGLRLFNAGGSDPVGRRLEYFGGAGARRHYERTGRIPNISDGNLTAQQYVRATGGQQAPRDPYDALFQTSGQNPPSTPGQTNATSNPPSPSAPSVPVEQALAQVAQQANRIAPRIRRKFGIVDTAAPAPDYIDKSVPNMVDMLTAARNSPEAQQRDAIRQQVAAERAQRIGPYGNPTLPGILHLVANPVQDLTGLFRSEEENINRETDERMQQQRIAAEPEVTDIRKEYGAMPAAVRSVAAPVIGRGGGGLLKTAGGIASLFGLAPNELSDWANKRGEIIETGSALAPLQEKHDLSSLITGKKELEEVQRGVPEEIATGVADLGVGLGRILLLKKATGLSFPTLMALEGAAVNSDKPADQQIGKAIEGYVLGRALDSHLSKGANAALFGIPTAAQSGYEVSQGRMSPLDATIQTAIQAAAGAVLTPGAASRRRGEISTRLGAMAQEAGPRERPSTRQPPTYDLTRPQPAESFLRDESGQPLTVYHQTTKDAAQAIRTSGFDLSKARARRSDEGVPDGVFFKPEKGSIFGDLANEDSVELAANLNVRRPLQVGTREELTQWAKDRDPEYARLADKVAEYDRRRAFENREKTDEYDNLIQDATAARARLTALLKSEGYDGVIIERDMGGPRVTKTFVALDPKQVRLQEPEEARSPVPVPEGYVRYYRADRPEAAGPEGRGWVNNLDYVSGKYGKGAQSGESIWYVDVPKQALESEYGDAQAASILRDDPKSLDATEPKLYRRIDEPQSEVQPPVEAQRETVEPAAQPPTLGQPRVLQSSEARTTDNRAADTQLPEESAQPQRFYHRDYGEVIESPNQKRVGKGRVRVVAEDGSEHVVKKPSGTGAGNQRAVPVKETSATPEPESRYSPAIQDAFKAWNDRSAYIDNSGNYRVKAEGQSSGRIAPWNKGVKDQFPFVRDFHTAAKEFETQQNRPQGQTETAVPEHIDERIERLVGRVTTENPDLIEGEAPTGARGKLSNFLKDEAGYVDIGEIARNIRRIRDRIKGREEKMLRYALRLPSGRDLGVNLTIDDQGTAFTRIGALEKFEKPGMPKDFALGKQRLDVGVDRLLALKRYLLKQHPEITRFEFSIPDPESEHGYTYKTINVRPRVSLERPSEPDLDNARQSLAAKGLEVRELTDQPLPTFSVVNQIGKEVARFASRERDRALQSLSDYASRSSASPLRRFLKDEEGAFKPDELRKRIRALLEENPRLTDDEVLGHLRQAAAAPAREQENVNRTDAEKIGGKSSLPAKQAQSERQGQAVSPNAPQLGSDVSFQQERTALPEGSTTSARRNQLASDRADLDLPELPPAQRKSWQQSLAEAKPERAGLLADEVLRQPRALNDSETASIVVRAQQIKNEHAAKLKEIEATKDAETLQRQRAELSALESEFDKLTTATKQSGTEKGRTLAAQKLTINQDFDLVSVVAGLKAAKGRDLTPAERAQAEEWVKEKEQLEAKIAELQANQNIETQIKQNRPRRPTVTKESIDAEWVDLQKQFAEMRSNKGVGAFFKSEKGELDPEAIRLIGRMVRNRIQAGVHNAEDLVREVYDAVRSHVSTTEREVRDAISGYSIGPKTTRSEAQRQVDALKSELRSASKEEDISAGRRSPRQEGPKPHYVKNVQRQQEIQRQIDSLEGQIRTGVFQDRPRHEPPRYTRETYRLQKRLDEIRGEYERAKYRASRGRLGLLTDTALGAGNVPKTMLSMGDVSAMLRQGGIGFVQHPILSSRAAVDMLHSFTAHGFANVENAIKSHPDFELAKRSGLEFTGVDAKDPRLSHREEGYLGSDVIDQLSKVPVAGKVLTPVKMVKDFSERTFVSFLDSQRMRIFSEQANRLRDMNLSPKELNEALKATAQYTNIITGRGSLGRRGNQAAPLLNMAMFSPRLVASRVQFLNKMFNPVAWARMPKGARELQLKDNAKFLVATAGTLALANAASLALTGHSAVGLDPDDADFLKIRVGDTRYDILTGLQQPMRFFYRMALAMKGGETYSGETKSKILGDFARSKAAPGAGMLWDYLEGKNRLSGKKFEGKDVAGGFVPLPAKDIIESIQQNGALRGTIEALPTFLGVGVQTYKDAAEKPHTPAEKLARRFVQRKIGNDEGRTQEQIDTDSLKSELRARARRGEDISADVAALGSKITPQQAKRILGARSKTRLQEDVNGLGPAEAILVWQVASPEQRAELKEIIERKAALIDLRPPEEQPALRQKFSEMGIPLGTRRLSRPSRESRPSRSER